MSKERAEGWMIALELKAMASPQVNEAVRLWVMGEDAETAAQKAGVPEMSVVTFTAILAGLREKTREAVIEFMAACGSCGFPMGVTDKFCMQCGAENPLFDESAYTQSVGNTFAEDTKKECGRNHPGFPKRPSGESDDKTLFCYLCGKRLY